MRRIAAAALAASCAVCVACGPKRPPNAVTPDEAIVVVRSNVPDAQIYVDGRFIGPLGFVRRGVAMDPGHHRLELRRDNYFSRYVELDLRRAERRSVQLEMAPVLP